MFLYLTLNRNSNSRQIVKSDLSVNNLHSDIIVEIGEVSTNQTGVNFLNESGKEFKTD